MLEFLEEMEAENVEKGRKRGTPGAVDAPTESPSAGPAPEDVAGPSGGTGEGPNGADAAESPELTPEAPPPVEKKPRRKRKRKKEEEEAAEAVRFIAEHAAEILGGILADVEDVFLRSRGYPGLTDPERVRIVSAVRVVLERRGPGWLEEYGDLIMLAASLAMPVVVRSRGLAHGL